LSKIVVTGASGMLGRALMRELETLEPIGTYLTRAHAGLQHLDLLDAPACNAFFTTHRPSAIIHAAAERRPDVSQRDPERARALNVEATSRLARLAKETGAWILYISTDYVFDGTKPPYRPSDQTNPLNFYGQTKLEGEQALLSETTSAAILRLGVLFGRVEYPEESAVLAVIKDIRAGKPLAVDDWGQRYPTFVDDVAVVCRQMADRQLAGVWHLCGNERYTKFQQARIIGEVLGLSTAHLTPDPAQPSGAPRPRDCELDCSGLEGIGLGGRTPFRQALEIVLAEDRQTEVVWGAPMGKELW
jgi:dTDP-4-dehydrorhamnose reductase